MATATPRESRKITYSSEIRNLKKVPFTERQKSIIIGCVLGDACLHPNWSSTNYTLKIKEYIRDPLTVALWFMDDGNVKLNYGVIGGYNINTQSFTKEENEILVQCFADLHGINARVERNKGYFRIGIYASKSRSIFREMIQAHVISSMQYKFG